MGRRIPRGAGWRLVAIITLVIALVATFPQGARAASSVAVSVSNEVGGPLAGATFSVYAASVDGDGLPAIAPDGFRADAAGDQFLTTDPAVPGSLAIVNAARPAADQTGTIVVTVTGQPDATTLDGVAIDVRAVDASTGLPGEVVASTISDTTGQSQISLPAGSYVVSVLAPSGYRPAAAQPIAVSDPVDGSPAVVGLAFGLQPDPTDPSVPPVETVDPTATAPIPATVEATATVVIPPDETAVPTGTTVPDGSVAPTVEPSVEATVPVATDAPVDSTNPPAYVAVRAIVCTSDDPEVIGTTVINPNEGLADGDEGLLPECRAAREEEFTFVFRDLRTPDPWDDLTLGQRPTDSDGIALFNTVASRPGQSLLIFERNNPNGFSSNTTVPLVADGTVSMLAIVVVGEPEGDVAVRTLDSISGQPVASACYELAAAGAADVPLASACDADDGADGTVMFPEVANGDYVVVPETTPAGYLVAPASPLTVASQPVEVPLTAVPYGTLQLLARSCPTLPPGVLSPTPTPAPGDGIDGLGATTTGTQSVDVASPSVVFSAVEGSAIDAAGTGLEVDPVSSDCTAVGASLRLTAPDGTMTTIAIDPDGVATPLSLPPTTGEERYVIVDEASGAEIAVAIAPATTAAVTMLVVAGT